MAGDPRFLASLDDLRALHLSKGFDYADASDPLKNYVSSARDGGVEPWRAAFLRLSEKYHRIVNLLNKGGEPNHESLDDTFMDLAAMSLIVKSLRAREAMTIRTPAFDHHAECGPCASFHAAVCQADGDDGA